MKIRFFILLFLLSACTTQPLQPTPTLRVVSAFIPLGTETSTVTPIASATLAPTSISTPAATLVAYEQYTIEYLRSRSYGGGTLDVAEKLVEHEKYTTY